MKYSILLVASMLCLVLPVMQAQTIQTIAGKGTIAFNGDKGPAIRASFYNPILIALHEPSRTIYVGDFYNNRIRIIDSNGYIRSLDSIVSAPSGLVLDKYGELYVSDGLRIYRFPKAGGKILVAGNGNAAYNGDNIAATSASMSPLGLAFDAAGNLYIADGNNNRIRKIDAGGIISTVAGTGTAGFNGDSIAATSAMLKTPRHIAFDKAGRLIIADGSNNRIRRVSLSGVINTIAGNGTAGKTGDSGLATNAAIGIGGNMVIDSIGNLYFPTAGFHTVRMVDTAGYIWKIAGTGVQGFSGDGGHPLSATFWNPGSLAMTSDQSLYIADVYNQRIRKICTPATVPTSCSIHVSHSNPGAIGDTLRFTTVFTPWAAGVIYKWRVNGGLVSTDSFFAYPWLSIGDTITVEVLAHDICNPFFRDTTYVQPLDVPDLQQQIKVAVYPNPASGTVIIQTKDLPEPCHATLTDIQSRSLLSLALVANSRNAMELSGVPAGTYFLNVVSFSGRRRSFVFQHY